MSDHTETVLLRVLLPVPIRVLAKLVGIFPKGTLMRETGGVLEFYTVEGKEVAQ